MKEHFR